MTDITLPAVAPADYFDRPYVDIDEWREVPRRRYIHGGFHGTELRFSFHFPPAEQYEGRFFQYIAPVPDSEHFSEGRTGEEDKVSFCMESGAIFVETNGGGAAAADPMAGLDPTIGAFRANAAAATYVRTLAQEMYGEHRVFGYSFGGSGGGFRTIGGAENTTGVWDGFVPYVIGSPLSIPNCFTARLHALRVLHSKFDEIVDALEPGGSGDPYKTLNDEESAAFTEVTKMGFPPQSWFAYRTMGMHGLAALFPGVRAMDPTYFEDFWTVPGYLGADPTESLLAARVQLATSIRETLDALQFRSLGLHASTLAGESTGAADDAWQGSARDASPVAVRLADVPTVDPQSAELVLPSGARIVVLEVIEDVAILGPSDPRLFAELVPGTAVSLDNSGFLAIQTYHRHQVPAAEFSVWDQFRDADGQPIYPQRPFLIGPVFAAGLAGTIQRGEFTERMIVVECLLDREAYPWQADWYRTKVEQHFGSSSDDHFRLWMTESAIHADSELQEHPSHTVSYLGMLHQALRDLAAWVERDIPPAPTTAYEVVDGQIVLPESALARRGIQPTIVLTANGTQSIKVGVNEQFILKATSEAPGVGSIVSFQWDVEGNGEFDDHRVGEPASESSEDRHVSFPQSGIYYPTVRVVAHRDGRGDTPFARVQNVTRVRVEVG